MRSRVLISTSLTALIGAAHSTGVPALMCLALLYPIVCAVQLTRWTSALCAVVYYLACGWPMIAVAQNYLGQTEGTQIGLFLWLGAALVLASPWLWAWSPHRSSGAVKACAAIVIGLVPPLGIIGFGSPIIAAGFLFPNTAWLGLAVTAFLPSAILIRPALVVAALPLIVIAVNNGQFETSHPRQPPGWESVNTKLGTEDNGFQRLSWVRAQVEASDASVLIFPENVIPNWTIATDLFWQDTERTLANQDRVALIGATVPGRNGIRNVLLIRGAQIGVFDQRIPVPVGMWLPFSQRSVPLNLTDSGVIEIRGQRAAVLICYEQILPWSWISSMAQRPSVAIAIANDSWSHNTPLPGYRAASARSWTRLFGVPLLSASND